MIDDEKIRKEIDWEQRRYEIAKDVLAHNYADFRKAFQQNSLADTPSTKAVGIADALIARLQDTSK